MTSFAALLAASQAGGVLLELGAVLLVLAVVGRIAHRIGLPTIPLYLIAGLLMGKGSLFPLHASTSFVRVAADIGAVLLLLLLGLEYTPDELQSGLRRGWRSGLVDLVMSGAPGVVMGLVLGWGPVAAVVLGGVTYVSSSGIISKQLSDLGRIGNRETPTVLTILVLEDLVMAIYLPIVGVLIVGKPFSDAAVAILFALVAVGVALVLAIRFGHMVTRALDATSSELLLFGVLGLTLLAGGLTERVKVSAAVAAFLVGVALSDQVAERGRHLLEPIRDVFGGLFFVYFGLQVDARHLAGVLGPAVLLAVVGAATKIATGWWAARRDGVGVRGAVRAGLTLVPRGEFSIVIAGLALTAGTAGDLGSLAVAYVLVLAIVGSLLVEYADRIVARWVPTRSR